MPCILPVKHAVTGQHLFNAPFCHGADVAPIFIRDAKLRIVDGRYLATRNLSEAERAQLLQDISERNAIYEKAYKQATQVSLLRRKTAGPEH